MEELTKENEVAVSELLEERRKGSCPKDRKREKELKMIKLPTFSSSLNSKYLGYLALASTAEKTHSGNSTYNLTAKGVVPPAASAPLGGV